MYCYGTIVGVILAPERDFIMQTRQLKNSEFTMEEMLFEAFFIHLNVIDIQFLL